MTVLTQGISAAEWEQIVRYYLDHSPSCSAALAADRWKRAARSSCLRT